ncbi:MAG: alpha-L-arabinofuranosidase C-terminal domain-containing protein [Candidatus Alcyoniella australis]|nr:alpha-L-arabinofuranosidase C-terminal domain-containing protein [Candidatus Alcyoniella australis]
MTDSTARVELGRPEGRAFRRDLLGHFIENMAKAIYRGGLMAQHGEERDVAGTRKRIVELLAATRPPLIRWPGGLFADGYDWRCGVGPLGSRKTTPNRYWRRYGPLLGARDPHTFGTLEFAALCQRVGADPYINVNLGTGTPEQAAAWAEYCTGDAASGEGARRADHGHPQPVPVKLWGIGNESYGFWALGHSDAETYARRYLEFVEAMDEVDHGGRYVAVGADLDWLDWNVRLFEIAGHKLDLLSIHTYLPSCNKPQHMRYSNMATGRRMLAILGSPEEFAARIDAITARIRSSLGDVPLRIALDEWGLWWWVTQSYRADWKMRDAVALAGTLHMLAARPQVELATYAQFINVLGLVRAWPGRVVPTAAYHVFQLYGRSARSLLVPTKVDGPCFDAPGIGVNQPRSSLPKLMALATCDEQGATTLFLINRDPEAPLTVELAGEALELGQGAVLLGGNGPLAANSARQPSAVRPRPIDWRPGNAVQIPPCSIAVLGVDDPEQFIS